MELGIAVNPDKAYKPVLLDRGQKVRLVFQDVSDEYVVAQTKRNEFALINIGSGNRWRDPITFETNCNAENGFKSNVPLHLLLDKDLLYSSKEALKFYVNRSEVFVKVYKVKS